MADADEIKRAEAEYNAALAKLQKCIVGNQAFGIESQYGQAYQYLVRLGVRPQIKLKYRSPRG